MKKILSGVVVLGVVGCGAIKFSSPEVTVTTIQLKSGTEYKKILVKDISRITITLSDAPTVPSVIGDKDMIATICTDLNLNDPKEPEGGVTGTAKGEIIIESPSLPPRTIRLIDTTKLEDRVENEVIYTAKKTINRAWLDAILEESE